MRKYKYEWWELYLECSMCWKLLRSDNYNKDSCKKFWFRNECKSCRHIKRLAYYYKNKQKILERGKRRVENNKIKVDWYKRKYRENNKDKVSKCQKNNRERHNNELWFNRDTFHQKAILYVRKKSLRPKKCLICGNKNKIVMHHPSYWCMDDWSKIVFCCQSCHKKIHSWLIKCPKVIDLLQI